MPPKISMVTHIWCHPNLTPTTFTHWNNYTREKNPLILTTQVLTWLRRIRDEKKTIFNASRLPTSIITLLKTRVSVWKINKLKFNIRLKFFFFSSAKHSFSEMLIFLRTTNYKCLVTSQEIPVKYIIA